MTWRWNRHALYWFSENGQAVVYEGGACVRKGGGTGDWWYDLRPSLPTAKGPYETEQVAKEAAAAHMAEAVDILLAFAETETSLTSACRASIRYAASRVTVRAMRALTPTPQE